MQHKADLCRSTRALTRLVGGRGATSETQRDGVPASHCGWKRITQEGERVQSESLCRHGEGGKSNKGMCGRGALPGCSGEEIR